MNVLCRRKFVQMSQLNISRLYFPFNSKYFHLQSNYIQGQNPEDDKRNREYFYFIDHQGMLFLDDSKMKNFTSCFKEKKFLKFFVSRIRFNTLNRYNEFPFLSLCGTERNYIRCDDLPIVFTHLIDIPDDTSSRKYLSYGYADTELVVPFEPENICMLIETGRVYHPAPEKMGGVGLIRSKLAIQLSPFFRFDNGESSPPTHIKWNGEHVELTQNVLLALEKLKDVRKYSTGIWE